MHTLLSLDKLRFSASLVEKWMDGWMDECKYSGSILRDLKF
jgi:hypothetical protein